MPKGSAASEITIGDLFNTGRPNNQLQVDFETRYVSILEFAATEYGRKGKVIATEDVKTAIANIGINRCARESGFDRKNFIRKLVRDIPVKRNSYDEFVCWLQRLKLHRHP